MGEANGVQRSAWVHRGNVEKKIPQEGRVDAARARGVLGKIAVA